MTLIPRRIGRRLTVLSWSIPGLRDPAKQFGALVVLHASFIGVVALAIDLVSSMTFGPPSSFAFGEQAVTFLLAYLGIVPAFLIALTSFAVSALTAVGSPSLFLLHRRYSLTRWEIPFWVLHGRTNRFHRALVLSLGLVASLLLLATSRQLGWSGNYPPTLLYVVFLVALVLVSTVVLLYWLIALRRPSEVVRETRLMGEDVIGEVIDSTEVGGLSRPIDWRGTTSPPMPISGARRSEAMPLCAERLRSPDAVGRAEIHREGGNGSCCDALPKGHGEEGKSSPAVEHIVGPQRTKRGAYAGLVLSTHRRVP